VLPQKYPTHFVPILRRRALQHAAHIDGAIGLEVFETQRHHGAGKQALVHFLVSGGNDGDLVQGFGFHLQLMSIRVAAVTFTSVLMYPTKENTRVAPGSTSITYSP